MGDGMTTQPTSEILATYFIETPRTLEEAAQAIAGEQSTGTFVAVPGETEDVRRRHRARIVSIKPFENVDAPSLPGAESPTKNGYARGVVEIAFPLENMGTNLPTVVATVLGNLTELKELSGIRLLDLDFPEAFADAYVGPQFGIEGTRRLSGVEERPIIGTIVKPSVGLSPEETARIVYDLALAGADFIKDDELMANAPHSPFDQRVAAVMDAVHRAAERTGRKLMYAFNITDDLDNALRHHDTVVKAGGTCVMVSLNSMGIPAVAHLRKHAELPIHGHRNGWGMYTRHPAQGMAFRPYQKLWKLAGVDHLHVNGIDNKFWEPNDSVVESARSVLEPLWPSDVGRRYVAMPVLSSGQWGGQAPETYRRLQSLDLMYLAGGGMLAHPGGPAAGCAAIRQAWEAAAAGIDLEEYAKDHQELAQSLERYGRRPK